MPLRRNAPSSSLTPCYYTDVGLATVYKSGQAAPYVKWEASGYRLPTEAEWERAARAGLTGKRFPWGDLITHGDANYHSFAHSSLFGLSNPPAIELARALIKSAPKGLARVFYSDDGSTAVEIALKMAVQYMATPTA